MSDGGKKLQRHVAFLAIIVVPIWVAIWHAWPYLDVSDTGGMCAIAS